MGYYTYHYIIWQFTKPISSTENFNELLQTVLEEITNYPYWEETDLPNELYTDHIKWYKMKEQMIEISQQFPNVIFDVYGVGEEHPDIWIHRFYNGLEEKQRVTIHYPPFTHPNLQQPITLHSVLNDHRGDT